VPSNGCWDRPLRGQSLNSGGTVPEWGLSHQTVFGTDPCGVSPSSTTFGPDEQPRGGLLADRLLAPVDSDGELACGGLGGLELELCARRQSLVVEPVEKLAVVLGQPDDRRLRGRLEVGERR